MVVWKLSGDFLSGDELGDGERCDVDTSVLSSGLEDSRHVPERALVGRSRVERNADIAAVYVVREGSLILHDGLLSGEGSPVAVVGGAALSLGQCHNGRGGVLSITLDERAIWVNLVFDQLLGQGVRGAVGCDVERARLPDAVIPASDVQRHEPKPCTVVD